MGNKKTSTKKQQGYLIPSAIVVAGMLVAGAVFFSASGGTVTSGGGDATASAGHGGGAQENLDIRPVTDEDHIRGPEDAPITFIEFSDFECPFCARLHPSLQRLISENDDVRWVYRHFPLSSIHSRARTAAITSECIARLGGNEAFWTFADTLFNEQRSLGDELYTRTAGELGIDAAELQSCTSRSEVADAVDADLDEALATGGRGTPYVVVETAQGSFIPFSGALPYAQLASVLEQARAN